METDVTLILARRRKKVIKVNTKLHMLQRCKYWKKKPKSKAPWDIQVCFFVILKVERIDFNSLVLILYIYLLQKRKLMCLFHPHCLDVYILPILTIFIFPYSPKKYFNSSSDISGHSSLVTNKLMFFLYDFIRCSFGYPHA